MSEKPLTYEKVAPNDYRWTSDAYDALIAGSMEAGVTTRSGIQTAHVSGPCPRCHHEVNFSLVLDAVTGERSGTLGVETKTIEPNIDEVVSITAACHCGELHEGRPEGTAFGCGINFIVEIETS